jgi:acyl-CoA synthetase (AMP-forming)/AMP-acid ligase II
MPLNAIDRLYGGGDHRAGGADRSPRFSSERVASLTTIFSGGAPIAPAMRDRVLAATGVTLRNAYGLTETVAPVIIAPAAPLAPCDPATGALSAESRSRAPACGS